MSLFVLLIAARPSWGQDWVDLTPATGPAPVARALASAVFDSQERRMVVFAGRDASVTRNDVWAFDLDTHAWTDLTPLAGPEPIARLTPVSVYDPVGHRMITWSGQGTGGTFFNDVWEFDLTANTWTQIAPTGGPPNIRYGAAGVLDPTAGDLVTFAGFTDQGRFEDVWRFNTTATTWADVSPTPGPIKRCLHSASYDAAGHRFILYGGQSGGPLGDVWALDLTLNAWTELTPVTGPTGRWFVAHVYDVTNHRATIFGGNTGSSETDEAWAIDLTSSRWFQLSPSGTPPTAREGAAAVYDGANDRMVIFGGRNGGTPNNEVWSLENLSDAPTGANNDSPAVPAALHPNHPNPFNPSTAIVYDIAQSGRVSLRIYDVRGRLVRTLVDEFKSVGRHEAVWHGRNDSGESVSSGVYFVTMQAGVFSAVNKAVLLK
jgi:hypothetical protein